MEARGNRNMVIALALIFAALNAGDWWTTRRLLARGGVERNPLMRAVLERFGFAGLAVVKLAIVGPIVAACVWFDLAFPLAVLSAIYCWVVWNNWRLGND